MNVTTPAYVYPDRGYVYSNRGAVAATHHQHLSSVCDRHTTAVLSGLRVPLRGASCLEVGAGAGSIACWLAEQVGQTGHVLATDLDPMPIPDRPQLEVRRHDIVTAPMPAGRFDVIHTRLLLMHLPQRVDVLRRLVDALAPGGVLVVEDWDQTWRAGRVLRAPSPAAKALWLTYHDALLSVFEEAGVDPGWASRAPSAMANAGLVDICTHIQARSWAGGTAGIQLAVTSISQLYDRLRAHGLSDEDLLHVARIAANPEMIIRGQPMVSTVGYQL